MVHDLTPFFTPRKIAVVGAGERPTSSGGAVLQMLRASGYPGEIVPVNPKGGTVYGMNVATRLADVTPPADLVVIVIRPELIPGVVADAAASGHRHVLILPGGFIEAGPEGRARDAALRRQAEAGGVTIAGPNSAGLVSMSADCPLAPTFLRDLPPGPGPNGGIALITQSGALAEQAVARANQMALPLSTIASVGNAMHLGVEDYLDFLGDRDDVSAVLLYIESVADPARLRTVARRVAARKPVVALFGGRTGPGSLAAQAHTAATPNSDAAIGTFCADAGMVRATSLRQLLLAAKGFGAFPGGMGRRVLVLSNSGGPGVLTTDMAAAEGLELPPLPNAMAERLSAAVPGEASIANPLDLLADAREDRFGLALESVLEDGAGQFDAILGIHVVPFMVDAGPVIARLAALAPRVATAGLPFMHSMMGTLTEQAAWFATMEAAGVPMFNDAESMAECAALLARYPAAKAVAADPAAADRPIALVARPREA